MTSGAEAEAVVNLLAHRLALRDVAGQHAEQPVVIQVGAMIHDEAELGMLLPPLHRGDDVLRGVIPKPDGPAIEGRRDLCEHFYRPHGGISFEFWHEVAGPRLPANKEARFVAGLSFDA